jgi:membrane protein DedA with SNARE-associated domain/rhodanese-related sulfurtransferase
MLIASAADLATTGPLIAFVSVLAGSLGIPIPTLAAIIFVGSLLATRHGSVETGAVVFAAAIAGAVLGDVAWFFAGRRYGNRVLSLICRLSLSRDSCVRRTAHAFRRRGLRVLLFARFLPGLSVISAPLAGISGVSLARFVIYAETGAALWIGTGLALGLGFSEQVGSALLTLKRFGVDLGGLAVAIILGFAGFSWFRRQRLLHQLRIARISPDELAALTAAGSAPVIIDARSAFEQDANPIVIPGARLLQDEPSEQDALRTSPLSTVVIYCSCPNEISAAVLAQRMRKLGFADVRPLLGGIDAWREAGYPVLPIARPGKAAATDQAVSDLMQTPAILPGS